MQAGRYDKLFDLASGGMGYVEVVARREASFVRLYARKRLHRHLASDPEFVSMFFEEARIAGMIPHPNVVQVLDLGRDDEGPFLIMDFVAGVSLATLFRRVVEVERWFPVQVAVRVALEIARALDAAHSLTDVTGNRVRIVHRDLSPHNVLLGFDGRVMLTDFGIAKVLGTGAKTMTGVLKGKVGYLAPEQARFQPIDARVDLFALGVLVYEMLAGERLYQERGDPLAAMRRITEEPPPDIGDRRFDVPPALVELLLELLAKHPDHRPESASVVAERLEEILAALQLDERDYEVVDFVGDHVRDLEAEQQLQLQRALAAPQADAEPAIDVDVTVAADALRPGGSLRRRGFVSGLAAGALLIGGSVALGRWISEPSPDPTPARLASTASNAPTTSPASTAPTPTTTSTPSTLPASTAPTPMTTSTPSTPASTLPTRAVDTSQEPMLGSADADAAEVSTATPPSLAAITAPPEVEEQSARPRRRTRVRPTRVRRSSADARPPAGMRPLVGWDE